MKALLLVSLLLSLSAAASDQWTARWEARVQEADNPDAKARDMASDWFFDHRNNLRKQDEKTVAEAQRIIAWMAAHDVALPSRVQAALVDAKPRPRLPTTIAVEVPDDTLQGDILPRTATELLRQRIDDARHHTSNPPVTIRAEIIDLGSSP